MSKCSVHSWKYYDVDEMGIRFRVCTKCDKLEGRHLVPSFGKGKHWFSYSPSGGIGFINAIKDRIRRQGEQELLTKKNVDDYINEDKKED